MMAKTLYGYWRSTTAYRVRIALNMAGVTYRPVSVNLVEGEQRSADYLALNPIGSVPSLVLDDRTVLTQSMAILEYLNSTYTGLRLLPDDPVKAAHVRAAAMVIACDIHPVNNLKVVTALKGMGHSQDEGIAWMNQWMERGLLAYQALLPQGTTYSFGEQPSLADVCLVPQLYNAHRWGADLTQLSRLQEIEERCAALPAFDLARPEAQSDASLDAH